MPTTVTKKIGATNSPTVMDYSTPQAWEDALPANLVTGDTLQRGQCYDQGEFTGSAVSLTVSGETTDATRYIVLECVTGAGFKDKAGVRTAALDYSSANGVAITSSVGYAYTVSIAVSYTRLIGLQIKGTATSADDVVKESGSITGVVVDSCILRSAGVGGVAARGTYKNTLVITSKNNAYGIRMDGPSVAVYGCTVVNTGATSGTGLLSSYTSGTIQNTAVFGYTLASSAGNSFTGDHNATDKSSVGFGSSNQVSLTFSSQFQSSSNDFRAIDTGSLDLNGTPDTTNIPTDISGTTRDASTPTIGCWEVASTAASSSTPRQSTIPTAILCM